MAGGTLKDLVVEAYFDAHPHRLYMRQARSELSLLDLTMPGMPDVPVF